MNGRGPAAGANEVGGKTAEGEFPAIFIFCWQFRHYAQAPQRAAQ